MSGSRVSFLLRPKWIAFHILVFASIAAMIWLAFWQLDRLDERRAFNDLVTEQIDRAPAPLSEVLAEAGDDPSSIEWRQVLVSGTYLPDQVLWFNRSQDGAAGDNVLSALITEAPDGETTVVVNRGFVPLGTATPPPPDDEVELLARVRVPQERELGELTDATDGDEPVTEVRRVDLGVLAAQLPSPMAPVYLDLVDAIPALTASDPIPVPAPTLDEGPHLSYAVQWLIFAVCVLIGWVLAVRRSLRTRARALTAAAASPVSPDSDRPDDVVAASSTNGTDGSSPR